MLDVFGSRRRTVERVELPLAALRGLRRHHPRLGDDAAALVADGLRQWYRVAQLAGHRPVAMPSQVVDDLWHEHIVCTRAYASFCTRAFGRFLHHHPEATMSPAAAALNRGEHLRTTYELARRVDDEPLPLLFALDERLRIPGGRRYVVDCGSPGACRAGGPTCLAHLPEARRGHVDGCGSTGWGGDGGCGGDSGGDGGGGCGGGD